VSAKVQSTSYRHCEILIQLSDKYVRIRSFFRQDIGTLEVVKELDKNNCEQYNYAYMSY